jgi:flagellar biosynthetic protein FliR
MVLTQPEILAWLGHFLWPFLRVTGLFLTAPLYGSPLIPSQVKAVLAAMYAAALAFWVPSLPPFPGDPAAAIYQGILQIGCGAAIGLSAQIVVFAVAGAGEIAGLSIGLGFAELQFREATTATPVLYDILFWVGMMAFLAAGGPIWLFAALAQSFGTGILNGGNVSEQSLLALGGTIFSGAVSLAMPVLAVALSVNLTVGLLSVFAPQLNVLSIGFPLLILAGFWMLAGATPYLGGAFAALMRIGLAATAQLLHG